MLPVLAREFSANPFEASLTVSAVVMGIAISILPIGALADRLPVHNLLLVGGIMVTACSMVAAMTHDLRTLVAVRFLQGLFIPSLTTCLVACLARSLPAEKLNVVMGSYVSAAVTGGLGGRLQSGRGRANALYVLFCYIGGFSGITLSGVAYSRDGWHAVVAVCCAVPLIPIVCGLTEYRRARH